MLVPVGPGTSLTHQTPPCCLPLPEGGAVLAVLLLQHVVVAQVLLAAAAWEGLHKLFLKDEKERADVSDGQTTGGRGSRTRTNLEADLALSPLPFPPMQADHEGFVALLPVQSHGFMALAERLDLVLLHVRNNLKQKETIRTFNFLSEIIWCVQHNGGSSS